MPSRTRQTLTVAAAAAAVLALGAVLPARATGDASRTASAAPDTAASDSTAYFSPVKLPDEIVLVLPPTDTVDPLILEVHEKNPSLALDAALWGAGTVGFSFARGHVRKHMFRDGWEGNIWANLKDPIGRAIESVDRDPFYTNYISHPLTWGGMGYYMKARGYSNTTALVFTQVHSVIWEYVIEGSWAKPSGRDLVTNFVAPVVSIYALYPLLNRKRPTPGSPPPTAAVFEPSLLVTPELTEAGPALGYSIGINVRH